MKPPYRHGLSMDLDTLQPTALTMEAPVADTRMSPFLMFEGRAEEAMNLYVSTIPNSMILDIKRYGADGPGPEGSVIRAHFSLSGQPLSCSDSFIHHAFTFTPSMSLFITCASEAEFDRIADALAAGEYLMPKDNYGFSRNFAWFNDRFGVSWQLNLE
jgi:predicted 3-demethylubiquinone-9 3-methyltransferase (glyoxalase superfamily)